MMALMASSAMLSSTTTSTSIFGSRLTLYSLPRYTAVWPFCLPCPRTSVTVTPPMPSFSSASRTSSTLFGRTILLINFIAASKHALQVGAERLLCGLRELRSAFGDVKDVDCLLPFRRDQHQIDVAAVL